MLLALHYVVEIYGLSTLFVHFLLVSGFVALVVSLVVQPLLTAIGCVQLVSYPPLQESASHKRVAHIQ